jgi:hypothetical protein
MKLKISNTKSVSMVCLAFCFIVVRGSAWAQQQKGQAVHYTVTNLGPVGASPGPLVITNDGLIAESVPFSNAGHAAILCSDANCVSRY